MRRWLLRVAVAVVAVIALAGCGDTEPTTPTAPTTPTTVAKTETLTGTLAVSETKIHAFGVQPGTVTATLTSLAPDATIPIGLGVGMWDGLTCNAVLVNAAAVQGNSLLGTASAATNICVKVYDVGNLGDTTANYTVTVQYQVIGT